MTALSLSSAPLPADNPARRLRQTAAAVRVQFTWWGVHKTLTAQQKEEVGSTYAADARFLTAGKKIINVRHEAFRKLTSLRSRIVSFWRGLTLPYVEAGVRLIRQADIESFVHVMEGFREDLLQAEADLNAVYDEILEDARQQLGRLFDPADYPPQIRGLFDVAWDFPAVEPPSYLMRIAPQVYEQEQQRVAQRFEEAVRLAEEAFLAEFAKLVSHLTERLSTGPEGERKVFRDTAITNLMEFFEKFKQLNVRSNAQLDELVEQAQKIVRGTTPQDLRSSDGLRIQVAQQLAGVQSSLDQMLVDRPRRKILRWQPSSNGAEHDVDR